MSEVSFASLEPSLLARKGGAKPAMRPQLTHLSEAVGEDELEDLGWNDMGDDDAFNSDFDGHNAAFAMASADPESAGPASAGPASAGNVFALPPARSNSAHARNAANEDAPGQSSNRNASPAASPLLQRQHGEDSRSDLADAAMPLPASREQDGEDLLIQRKLADRSRPRKGRSERRAAFTLRLDAERHLKLRLAATMHNTSAQSLVTDALDSVFAQIKDLDSLAARFNPG